MDLKQRFISRLVQEESDELKLYYDSRGIPTIGKGRNLVTMGISQDESDLMSDNDYSRVLREATEGFPWFKDLSNNRKLALLDMIYNMGLAKFLKFHDTIKAIEVGDFFRAAAEIRDSDYGRSETRHRADRNARMMRYG